MLAHEIKGRKEELIFSENRALDPGCRGSGPSVMGLEPNLRVRNCGIQIGPCHKGGPDQSASVWLDASRRVAR